MINWQRQGKQYFKKSNWGSGIVGRNEKKLVKTVYKAKIIVFEKILPQYLSILSMHFRHHFALLRNLIKTK